MSVTAPLGFRAAGVSAGLRAGPGPDVALVVNDGPHAVAAGVVTSNRIKAAPVLWTQQVLTYGAVRAVVLNAGGANACTGSAGFADAHRTAEHAAALLGCGGVEIAICSTGLIGERLALPLLLDGVQRAVAGLGRDGTAAASAICTTDTRSKQTVQRAGGVTVGGMAKGAGMLAPGLATMLCVLTTDAVVDASALDRVLRAAVARTFDRVDTDGCMSTNDTVLLLASGASGEEPEPEMFGKLVHAACDDLARQLVADAEGASKQITVDVVGAIDERDAVVVGRAVARSNLLKCAVHGADPNWGRVLAAVGTTDAVFEPDAIDVAFNDVWLCRGGAIGADRRLADLSGPDVRITIDLHAGTAGASILTTDLTADYVHENSAYST